MSSEFPSQHNDVINWKHFPRNWPFVRSPVNSPHKGQWRGALMFSLIYVWIRDWVNNREAGDLRRYRAHYDVIIMKVSVMLPCYAFIMVCLSVLCYNCTGWNPWWLGCWHKIETACWNSEMSMSLINIIFERHCLICSTITWACHS